MPKSKITFKEFKELYDCENCPNNPRALNHITKTSLMKLCFLNGQCNQKDPFLPTNQVTMKCMKCKEEFFDSEAKTELNNGNLMIYCPSCDALAIPKALYSYDSDLKFDLRVLLKEVGEKSRILCPDCGSFLYEYNFHYGCVICGKLHYLLKRISC